MLLPSAARASVWQECRDQAAIAERAEGIPAGLLLAIGERESGRYDMTTGTILPWPWAVNREGEGRLFETRDEAIAYVKSAQRAGSESIDVGCFQINLKAHPLAFRSVEEAFDPAANAAFAAHFLAELHTQEGNWEKAVAYYHSANPWFGSPYRDAVLATWHGLPGVPAYLPTETPMPPSERVVMGIHIWTPRSPYGPIAMALPRAKSPPIVSYPHVPFGNPPSRPPMAKPPFVLDVKAARERLLGPLRPPTVAFGFSPR